MDKSIPDKKLDQLPSWEDDPYVQIAHKFSREVLGIEPLFNVYIPRRTPYDFSHITGKGQNNFEMATNGMIHARAIVEELNAHAGERIAVQDFFTVYVSNRLMDPEVMAKLTLPDVAKSIRGIMAMRDLPAMPTIELMDDVKVAAPLATPKSKKGPPQLG